MIEYDITYNEDGTVDLWVYQPMGECTYYERISESFANMIIGGF